MTILYKLLPCLCALAGFASATPAPIITHMLESPHQTGPVPVEILTPDTLESGRSYPVLYILPVAPDLSRRVAWASRPRISLYTHPPGVKPGAGRASAPFGDHARAPR